MPPNPTIPNNAEIDQALKEFEAKNAGQASQAPKAFITPQKETSGISFETDNLRTDKLNQENDAPKIVRLAMKWFGTEEQKQAEYVLLGFVIVAVIVSLFLFFGGGAGGKKVPPMTPEQKSYMETGHGL